MPSRMTTAGRKWIKIAERNPDRDSTAILKLAQFAAKLDSDDRKLRRLIRVAARDGYLPDVAEDLGDTLTTSQLETILSADEDTNRPPEPHNLEGRSLLADINATIIAKKRHQERLEWWVERAAQQGWDTSHIQDASDLSREDIEPLIAAVFAERKAREKAVCDYCRRRWITPSIYCVHFAKHEQLAKAAERGVLDENPSEENAA